VSIEFVRKSVWFFLQEVTDHVADHVTDHAHSIEVNERKQ